MKKNTDDSFSKRLTVVRKSLNLTQKQLAEKLKISNTNLSQVEKGKYKPGHNFFYRIGKEYNVNLNYLLFGEEEMFRESAGLVFETGNEDLKEMLYYLSKSKAVQYRMLSHFKTYFISEESSIKKEIESLEREEIKKSKK